MQNAVLSLDVGTTITKAVLFDLAGNELALAEKRYRLLTSKPGWVELDPLEVWESSLQVLKAVTTRRRDVDILAVSLSTQGGTLLPLNAKNEPACNAITWLDKRSADIVDGWRTKGLDQQIRKISGWDPQPGLPLPSLCALRLKQVEVFNAAQKFVSVNDYLVYRLTGNFCTNPSMAGEMLLTDIKTGDWSGELCELAGIQPSQLSPIRSSESICGSISTEVCRHIGLREDTPLINGGQDHSAEALALGITSPGSLFLACGTAWVINAVTASSDVGLLPPQMALNPHVIPERWVASQFLGGLGAVMEWWLEQFWQAPPPATSIPRAEQFTAFDAALTHTTAGSSGLLFFPVSGVPRLGKNSGGYAGLRLDHNRADMGRAVLESAAYELRWALDDIRKFGFSPRQLWMVGGATRSPVWAGILADVTGIPISLTQYSHGPALGAALLAAKGLGYLEDFPVWISAQTVQPNPQNAGVYEEMYAVYQQASNCPAGLPSPQ